MLNFPHKARLKSWGTVKEPLPMANNALLWIPAPQGRKSIKHVPCVNPTCAIRAQVIEACRRSGIAFTRERTALGRAGMVSLTKPAKGLAADRTSALIRKTEGMRKLSLVSQA